MKYKQFISSQLLYIVLYFKKMRATDYKLGPFSSYTFLILMTDIIT